MERKRERKEREKEKGVRGIREGDRWRDWPPRRRARTVPSIKTQVVPMKLGASKSECCLASGLSSLALSKKECCHKLGVQE